MEYRDFRMAVEAAAKAAGLTDYELYYQRERSQSMDAFHGEIDGFKLGESIGVCFRCILDGKTGIAATECMEQEEAAALVAAAIDSAKYVETDEPEFLNRTPGKLEAVSEPVEADVQTQMDALLAVEKGALEADKRITSVSHTHLMSGVSEKGIFNSYGVDKVSSCQYYGWYASPVAAVDSKTYNGFGLQLGRTFDALNADTLIADCVEKTVSQIGSVSPASGKYRVVLDGDVVSDFLSTFDSIFSSEAAQKGLSLLKGKEGEAVASECVTLLDDPFCPGALFQSPFDDEGVEGQRKALIENGVLKTLLYNLKTAAKEGRESTGNACKAGLSGRITVAPTNLLLAPGEKSLDDLFAEVGDGLFITEISGTHAGADAITGDFSLVSRGFRITDGKRGQPLELFTVAGNFFQLLKDIQLVGSDLRYGFPNGAGQIITPSVVVRELAVSGE